MISTIEQLSCTRNHSSRASRKKSSPSHFKRSLGVVLDLCCGLGGLSLAARELGFQIAGGVDLNANALKTFQKNFPEANSILGDICSKQIILKCANLLKPLKATGQPSIIISGPPCQGFSIAGSRDPADPRNKVLIAVARTVAKLQPDCALIENVSMLLAGKYAGSIRQFERIFQKAGFRVMHIVLDASEFGVPQRRKRAFFLVTRNRLEKTSVLARLEKFKANPVGAKEALKGLPAAQVRPDNYEDEIDGGRISNHFAMQHSEQVKKKIAMIEPGKGPMSYRRLHPTRLSNTLFSGHRAPPAHFKEPRSITVREAARLQGFPDDFRIYGSFGNQMEQVTNAVPPPLASVVLRVLLEFAQIPVPAR